MSDLIRGLVFDPDPDSNGNSALSRFIKSEVLSKNTPILNRISSYITEPKEGRRIELAREELRSRLRSAAKIKLVSVLIHLHEYWRIEDYPCLVYKWDMDENGLTIFTFHNKFFHLSRDEVDTIMEDDPDFFEKMKDLDLKYDPYWGWAKNHPWYY